MSPVELKKTGSPLGSPDPDVTRNVTNAALKGVFKQLRGNEVPYSAAPPLKASNFEELEELALLDAKTHRFAEAWEAGYTGAGSVVSVLDGGTDFGHPDLIGTWQTRATTGWPNAFDPFGTLVLLVQPGNVDLGLTWYTKTEAKNTFTQSVQDKGKGIARVSYDVRVGPSRNFAAPDAKVTRTYSFPRAWTKSGTVRLGGHPDDHLLGLFGERAAFIVVDPTTAGVYDTVYVDLDNDHSFVDEKPVTRESPASYRDMNGDGVTDVSGGLLYYISNGTGASGAALPGGPSSFGLVVKDAPGALLAWTGDFDPAIGGHGTLTASNVVGQGVDQRPCPDLRRRARWHTARHGHRRRPARQARPDGRHLLLLRLLDPVRLLPDAGPAGPFGDRHHVELVRQLRRSTTTASTRPARKPTSGTRPSASGP